MFSLLHWNFSLFCTGIIPSELGEATDVSKLYLSGNSLSGKIDNLHFDHLCLFVLFVV